MFGCAGPVKRCIPLTTNFMYIDTKRAWIGNFAKNKRLYSKSTVKAPSDTPVCVCWLKNSGAPPSLFKGGLSCTISACKVWGMETHTTPAMSINEINARVLTARALLRKAANELITVARAMGDERDFSMPADDAVSLIREAHDLARVQGDRWEARAQA